MTTNSRLTKFGLLFMLITAILLAAMLIVFATTTPQISAVQSIILNQVPQTYLF